MQNPFLGMGGNPQALMGLQGQMNPFLQLNQQQQLQVLMSNPAVDQHLRLIEQQPNLSQ